MTLLFGAALPSGHMVRAEVSGPEPTIADMRAAAKEVRAVAQRIIDGIDNPDRVGAAYRDAQQTINGTEWPDAHVMTFEDEGDRDGP